MDGGDEFARARGRGLRVEDAGEAIPMIMGWRAVREAARDWHTFSSDAPFRVPIPAEADVRTVRQLPIETDPPVHTAMRALVEPFFRKPMQADYVARIDALVAELLAEVAGSGPVDIVRGFALPLQSRALAYLLGVDVGEADTWIGWGTHVFRDGHDPAAKGSVLDDYLRDRIARAEGSDGKNFFSALWRMEVEGRALSVDQMLGFANLTFAGGRDTVIASVSAVVAHFARDRAALDRVAADPRRTNLAVEEFVRAVSPLTHIGRVCTREVEVDGCPVPAGGRVSLGWAAANHDPTVFDAPGELRLDRAPNAHVGFGSGPHSCLGAPQARAILRALVRGLAAHTSHIEIHEAVPARERHGDVEREVGFQRLLATVTA